MSCSTHKIPGAGNVPALSTLLGCRFLSALLLLRKLVKRGAASSLYSSTTQVEPMNFYFPFENFPSNPPLFAGERFIIKDPNPMLFLPFAS